MWWAMYVAHPGAYDVSSLSTPLNALFIAGGPTSGGSLRIVRHFRGNDLVQNVDLYDLLLHGVKSDIERLENGDSVLVLRAFDWPASGDGRGMVQEASRRFTN